MKPMHLINSRCHYCSWCELLPPRFAVDQGYTAILVCSPIHSSSSLGGRKIDGNINGNMNESNLQAPAAIFWCMYTLKKGELEVTEDRREICHCFLRVGSPVVHLVIKPKQFYQTYVLHVPMHVFQSPFISRTKNISNYGKNKIAIPSLGNKWN